MAKFIKQEFQKQSVLLDGNEYVECKFGECEIMYVGGDLPKLSHCGFDNCRWKFYAGAARTILLMANMHAGGLRDIVETTVSNILGKSPGGIEIDTSNRADISADDDIKKDVAFYGARLKIKRAQKHIADFNALAQAFVDSGICRLAVERDSQSGQYVLKVEWTKTPPWQLPLILGDAIHSLRAALDYAWCDIITGIGETTDEFTRFRIFNDRNHLVRSLESGKVKKAPEIIETMADAVKAYRAGNNPLIALHDLDITDKHELIIPTFNVATLNGFSAYTVKKDGTPNNMISNCSVTIGEGGVLNFIAGPENFEIQNHGTPSFGIVFRKGQPFEGQAIVPTLHQLAQIVSGVLDAFDAPLRSYRERAA